MRKIIQAQMRRGVIVVVCEDGTLWRGKWTDDAIKWLPVEGPPDGEVPQRKRKSRLDRIEDGLRRAND